MYRNSIHLRYNDKLSKMTEVNIENFKTKYAEIEEALKRARFISIDIEYSALFPLKNETPSLFDNAEQRYSKLRKNLEYVIPLQIGLTAFSCDPKRGDYFGKIYNFYLVPCSFAGTQKTFFFQSDTLVFLNYYKFDFNKFVYLGIPFMDKTMESNLRKNLNGITDSCSNFRSELQEIYEFEVDAKLKNWHTTANEGDILTLSTFYKNHKNNYEILYFTHKYVRKNFKNVWTFIENCDFVIRKMPLCEIKKLQIKNDLEENLISDLLGFTKIFKLLTSLEKPIIGHNLYQDLLLMYQNFEEPLPSSYTDFKKILNQLFPVIFDTRVIAYDIGRNVIPKDKKWKEKGLESIFEYFKNGIGRHLALNSPAIEADAPSECYGKFHDAGWDSFCTGYIFIRMAYLYIYEKYPKSKTFTASELIAGISHLKNQLNLIRSFNSTIQIDGEDPESTRPPILVLESLKTKSIDIQQITSILSTCGFVEVKKLPYAHQRALIAVDNFGSLKRIQSHFQNNKEFRVMPYSTLRHSPIAKTLLLGGITISGAILAWILKK